MKRINYFRLAFAAVLLVVFVWWLTIAIRFVFPNKGSDPVASTETVSTETTEAQTSSAAASDTTEPTTASATSSAATTERPKDLEALKAQIDTAKYKPNEAGEVMIIMYHGLADENSEYHRTAESFRADLQRLYDMGFRTVSMSDYTASRFDVPAGTTPVVITFDDGLESTFRMLPGTGGQPTVDPNCMIGIMEDFAAKHPEFGKNAILYLNGGTPFGQEEYVEQKLAFLKENGYEIGNHTTGHEDLSTLNAEQIQEVLGGNANYYEKLTGIRMSSLALPYGIFPQEDLASYAVSGTYDGKPYHNTTVLKVGWRPTWPLYIRDIDPTALDRVQSGDGQWQLTQWLDNYVDSPENRYISDGVPEIITLPEAARDRIDPVKADENRLLFY